MGLGGSSSNDKKSVEEVAADDVEQGIRNDEIPKVLMEQMVWRAVIDSNSSVASDGFMDSNRHGSISDGCLPRSAPRSHGSWRSLPIVRFIRSHSIDIICILLFLLLITTTIIILGLPLWKSSLFILIIAFIIPLVIEMILRALFFLIERCSVTKLAYILYFVYALKTSVLYLFWCSSVFLAWKVFIKTDPNQNDLVHIVETTLLTSVTGIGLWILKIVILKLLACGLQNNNFFPDITLLVSQLSLLQTLLLGLNTKGSNGIRAQLNRIRVVVIRMFDGSASIVYNSLKKTNTNDMDETLRVQQVEATVSRILRNFKTKNQLSPRFNFVYAAVLIAFPREIHLEDVLLVASEKNEADVHELFQGRNCIDEAYLRDWTLKIYNDRKTLVGLVTRADEKLNIIMSAIVVLFSLLIWFFLMGFATKLELLIVASVMSLFVHGVCKDIALGLIFVFVQGLFNIGDRCDIDGKQMVVTDRGILKTEFLGENNEKVHLQNSYRQIKAIVNYNQSSDMRDTVELVVGGSTSDVKIEDLELKITEFLRSNPEDWHPEHSLLCHGIEDRKLKYRIEVTHTSSFQNYQVIKRRRSEFLLELNRYLRDNAFEDYSARF